MKKQVKELWVNALKSGEYSQTEGCLHNQNGFCCLGVLTDLYLKEHDLDWSVNSDGVSYHVDDEHNYLPEDVIHWAGLRHPSPNVVVKGTTDDNDVVPLANLNDSGTTFYQIAQLIEEQL